MLFLVRLMQWGRSELLGLVMKLLGVYHANGNSRTAYVTGKIQTNYCALCDITHGMVRTKEAFKECQRQTPVAFTNLHLNEQPDALNLHNKSNPLCVCSKKKAIFSWR